MFGCIFFAAIVCKLPFSLNGGSSTYTAMASTTAAVPSVKVASVKLNKNKVSLVVGKKTTLSTEVTPSNATNKTVIWTSSNKKVATV